MMHYDTIEDAQNKKSYVLNLISLAMKLNEMLIEGADGYSM